MSLHVETTEQEKEVSLYIRGAALNFTKNRRTILAVFLAATEPVTRYFGSAKSGTAQSGWVRTQQLVNFMPRRMKHNTRDIKATGARLRRLCVAATNHQRESFAEGSE